MPCIRYGEIYTTYNFSFNECVSHTDEKLLSLKKYFENGDILFAITGESVEDIGKCVAYTGKEKCLLGGDIVAMKHNQCPQFLAYALSSPEAVRQKGIGKTKLKVVHTNIPALKSIRILLPKDISTQESIVSYLDSSFQLIDKIKEKAQKSLSEAKALFQSALAEAMEPKEGTLMRKIGDVFTTYAGGTPLKSQKDYYEGGDIPWLRSGEVCKKYISETEMYITQKGMDNSSAKYYPENTVVVAMYGATAAQVGILKIKATSNQAVCGIIPHKDFIPEYVYYWFLFVQDDLASQAQGGAQPNISQIKIKNVLIPILKKEEQHQIVSQLDKLSSNVKQMEDRYKKIVEECDALKQAMLRDVFE